MSGGNENKQKTVVRGRGTVNEDMDPENQKTPEVLAATKSALGSMVDGMRPLTKDRQKSSDSSESDSDGDGKKKKKGKGKNKKAKKNKKGDKDQDGPDGDKKEKTEEEKRKEEEEQKAIQRTIFQD